ncbi:hypothetical protein D7X12_15355 [Corallococcus sicarius]|uniref:Lipoprotein n=1 Tax=Corallococcus sicarius TaxID=2316726 RepID=A0A3A8NK69_9BACT|nr:hypothetical protein D7X12_15355 [Corallococcus sicarius]
MQIKARISALLAVAMLAAGCGEGDVPMNEQSNVETRVEVAGTYSSLDGQTCTVGGVSPQLAALSKGPYHNCQGGTMPRTDVQSGTQFWSGCCGDLLRTCKVTGYSTQNTLICM